LITPLNFAALCTVSLTYTAAAKFFGSSEIFKPLKTDIAAEYFSDFELLSGFIDEINKPKFSNLMYRFTYVHFGLKTLCLA
jgi:hypothetical protein